MHTPAQISRHPVLSVLAGIPIGLWVFSLACDLAYLWGTGNANWAAVAFYTMMGGVIAALIAAVPGLIDLFSAPGSQKRTALIPLGINLSVVVLYFINAWIRLSSTSEVLPVWLSAFCVALLLVSAWLFSRMDVHGVALKGRSTPRRPRPQLNP